MRVQFGFRARARKRSSAFAIDRKFGNADLVFAVSERNRERWKFAAGNGPLISHSLQAAARSETKWERQVETPRPICEHAQPDPR
jgi:hypothetical protein